MDNHEEILDALTAFGKSPNTQEIPSILEQYLNCVAKNGETLFPWTQLKPLILRKMELVISELRQSLASENIPQRPNVENVRFDVIHARIIDSLHKFNGAPFTIQRLCELLIDPKRHYKRSDKFMRGLEKNVLVVSTVDPFGRKVVCESGNKPLVNGIPDINGSSYPPRESGLSIPLPPVPGWVTTTTAPVTTARTVSSGPSQESKTDEEMGHESASSEGDVVSNGVPGAIAVSSSVFSDQGDPLAVQSEEVVEETVVTMDTSEVSSVVTDGGEAMAETEGGDADMTEDREASSFSSSSSSSSEELSTSSDSVENSLRPSPFGVAVHSFNEGGGLDENRPWAAFAQDAKGHEEVSSHSSPNDQPVNLPEETQFSEASSSIAPSKSPETSSSVSSSSSQSPPSDTQSSPAVCITPSQRDDDDAQVDSQANQAPSDKASWPESDRFGAANQNFAAFDSAKSTSDQALPSMDLADVASEEDKQASSVGTAVTTTSLSDDTSDPQAPTSSSCDISRSYAQVAASSSDKNIRLEPFDSTEAVACHSVAGLERLVGSMEQSLSSSISPSSSKHRLPESSSSSSSSSSHQNVNSSSVPPTPSVPAPFTESHPPTLPSSSDLCSAEDEPSSKRPRLSVEDDRMEEDCISTTGDSSMDGIDETVRETHEQATIHSSVLENIPQQNPEDSQSMEFASSEADGSEEGKESNESRPSSDSACLSQTNSDDFENNGGGDDTVSSKGEQESSAVAEGEPSEQI